MIGNQDPSVEELTFLSSVTSDRVSRIVTDDACAMYPRAGQSVREYG